MKKICFLFLSCLILVFSFAAKPKALTYADNLDSIASDGQSRAYAYLILPPTRISTETIDLLNLNFSSGLSINFRYLLADNSITVENSVTGEINVIVEEYTSPVLLIITFNNQYITNNLDLFYYLYEATPTAWRLTTRYEYLNFAPSAVGSLFFSTEYLMSSNDTYRNAAAMPDYMQNPLPVFETYTSNLSQLPAEFYNKGYTAGVSAGAGIDINDYVLKEDVSGFIPPILSAVQAFLDIRFGSVTLGAIFLVPFSITFVWFIIRQFRGGGGD